MRFVITALLLILLMAGCVHPRTDTATNNRCPKCGAILFHARPGLTTKEDIREFAANSKLRDKEQIIADGWIHPGTYCPNGCYEVFETYKP
jgi:hypothetical protein